MRPTLPPRHRRSLTNARCRLRIFWPFALQLNSARKPQYLEGKRDKSRLNSSEGNDDQKVADELINHYNSASLARRWGASLKNGAQLELR